MFVHAHVKLKEKHKIVEISFAPSPKSCQFYTWYYFASQYIGYELILNYKGYAHQLENNATGNWPQELDDKLIYPEISQSFRLN